MKKSIKSIVSKIKKSRELDAKLKESKTSDTEKEIKKETKPVRTRKKLQ